MARAMTPRSVRSQPTGWDCRSSISSWSKAIPTGLRSTTVAGTAIYRACDKVVGKARQLAAHALECACEDVEYHCGTFIVRGTDRSLRFAQVADLAYHGAMLPPGLEPGLEVTEFYDPPDTNDPQGMHLAVVVVDGETGAVTLRDFFAVDDCGVVINPM